MAPENGPRKDTIYRVFTGTTYWFENGLWWAYYVMLDDPGPVSYTNVPYVLGKSFLDSEILGKVRDATEEEALP